MTVSADTEFEQDISRYIESIYDDTDTEVHVRFGNAGGRYVEIMALRDWVGNHITVLTGNPHVFYDVDSFRAYIDRYLPESY